MEADTASADRTEAMSPCSLTSFAASALAVASPCALAVDSAALSFSSAASSACAAARSCAVTCLSRDVAERMEDRAARLLASSPLRVPSTLRSPSSFARRSCASSSDEAASSCRARAAPSALASASLTVRYAPRAARAPTPFVRSCWSSRWAWDAVDCSSPASVWAFFSPFRLICIVPSENCAACSMSVSRLSSWPRTALYTLLASSTLLPAMVVVGGR